MLKAMRKNIKSLAPALWLVIAAFLITIFAVWGGGGRLGESRATNTIATIGKEKISVNSYYQNLRQRLEMLKGEFKDLNKNLIQQLNVPQQVLEQMIQQTLLLQKAQEMSIYASDEEIREKIISVFQRDGKFIGYEEYEKILNRSRTSISEFEGSLEEEIILNKLIKVLTAGITFTPEELWENYKKNNETAKVEFVILENDKVELEEEPSSIEAQEYFEMNKKKYIIPEKREAELVFFKTEALKKEIELTEPEIEEYYKENQPQFEEPERIKVSRIYTPYNNREKNFVTAEAQGILKRIQQGEDFGGLAKKYSKDKKASESGDWGLHEWKTLAPEEQGEIEKLSEGENSEIIKLEEGVSILKITKTTPSALMPLEDVKERIINILEDQKARTLAEERINILYRSAQKQKSLDVAAQISGLKFISTGLLKEGESIEDIDPSATISNTLFQLKEKEISSPIYTYKGVGLAQLQKVELPRQANYAEVEDEVKKEFIANKKKEKALEKMKNVKAELGRNNLEDLAEKYGLEYKTVNEHKREQYLSIIGENPEIDRLAFSLPVNEASETVEFENGCTLIKILDRKEVTKEDFEKNKETEKENLLEAKKNKFFHSYMIKLREEVGVKISYDLFLKINSDVLSKFGGEE